MKVNVKRETTIGLSILLVLLVILGVVAVRRFMRREVPLEAAIAREEEKRVEERPDHHSKREAEELSKPALLTPVETSRHDSLQTLDDPGHWKTESKERRRESPPGSTESGLIAADPPPTSGPSLGAEARKEEHERTRTFTPSEATPTANDDRYSTAATAGSAEHRKRAASGSMVVQVSGGEQGDGTPRPLDRYAAESRDPQASGRAAVDIIPPAPAQMDGPAAGMPVDPEAGHRHAERAREHEFHSETAPADVEVGRHSAEKAREHEIQVVGPPVDAEAARHYAEKVREHEMQAAAAPPSRYGYGPVAPAPGGNPPPTYAAPAGEAMPNYSGTAGGYGPENALRHGEEAAGRMRGQIRLRDDGMYEVQPNDSYWTISERVYGSGAYFRALAEQNRGKAARPDRLPPGLVISTPPVPQLEKDYPDLCPRPDRRETVRNHAAAVSMAATAGGGRTYVVQEGDTLSSIARYELGKVSRWAEIYQLNREALGKDYDYLSPGMRLVLPIRESPSSDRTTRRSDDGAPMLR